MFRVQTGTAHISSSSDLQCHLSSHLTELLWDTFLYHVDTVASTLQVLDNPEGDLKLAVSLHLTTPLGQEMFASYSEVTVISVRLR